MKENHSPYDVVLLPPAVIAGQATQLSNDLARQFPVEFVLDGKTKHPHVTLYQLEIADEDLGDALSEIENLTDTSRAVQSDLVGFSNHATFIFWDCEKSQSLMDLHKAVVRRLNRYRNGLKLSILGGLDFLTEDELKQIEIFGSFGLLEQYRPHITLTRMKSQNTVDNALKTLRAKIISEIVFDKIALGKLSDHGTVVEIVREYNLS